MYSSILLKKSRLIAACILIFMSGNSDAWASKINAPDLVITHLNNALIATMKLGPASSFQERYKKLYNTVSKSFNFTEIARFSLGGSWYKLSTHERHQFIQSLKDYSVANYAVHFDHYSGQQFTPPVSTSKNDHQAIVKTALISPNSGQKNTFSYLLRQRNGRWQIINVVTDGVSSLAMQKAELTSLLKREGFKALLNKLNAYYTNASQS
ncbi:MAG: ABC transporter substrate-binding protein [Acidithiobacillus sp.]|nr:ABC transporter substrate-binding protein [Acidithiobacillus sp.]